jgi:predicted peptidase
VLRDRALRAGSFAVMIVAGWVVAGCGGSGPTPSVPTTPSASAAPSAPATSTAATSPVADEGSSDFLTAKYAGTTDAPLGYYEYLPPSYADEGTSPLLVFLHGFGENGDGSEFELPLVPATGIPQLISEDRWSLDMPFVILAPQHDTPVDPDTVPDEDFFRVECDWVAEVEAFITYALAAYDVDPARVYLTGLSCGAYGAWMYVAEHGSSQIAAMVPIAGPADEAWERADCALGDVPIWAFHGEADDVVPLATAAEPMDLLSACPSPPLKEVEFTVYPGVDHDSWTRTYDLTAGNDIYEWMLGHTRSE